MIILATSIILVLSSSGIISNAQKSAFQSDIKTMEEELNVYLSTKYLETNGTYQKDSLNASKDTLEESGEVVEGKNIQDVITSMENKYLDKIVILKEGQCPGFLSPKVFCVCLSVSVSFCPGLSVSLRPPLTTPSLSHCLCLSPGGTGPIFPCSEAPLGQEAPQANFPLGGLHPKAASPA